MSVVTAIRAAIVTQLNDVGSSVFYEKERFVKRDKDLALVYGQQVDGGYIRLVSRKRLKLYENRHKVIVKFQVVYLHHFSDSNDSQLAFERNVEAFDEAFMADDELIAGVSHWTDDTAGITLDDAQPVMFAGVLCHRALMTIYAEYYE